MAQTEKRLDETVSELADQALAAGAAEPVVEDLTGGSEAQDKDLASALAEAEKQRDEYLDALKRLQAEFENYRKRARRELAEAADMARASVLRELLPVLDNLDRALNAAEHHEESKVVEGVRLTRALFADLLRKAGVEEVDPKGEMFDPSVHEAMMAAPSTEPEGTVVEVLEKGYVLGDRVLRPARVTVASGSTGSEPSVQQPT